MTETADSCQFADGGAIFQDRARVSYRADGGTTDTEDAIEIRGRVLDRDGAPVPDAMLEFWSAARRGCIRMRRRARNPRWIQTCGDG